MLAPAFDKASIIHELFHFPAFLSIILYNNDRSTIAIPGTADMDVNGNIDFKAHSHFILATDRDICSCSWRTTLVRCEHFFTPEAISNWARHLPLPLTNIALGGWDGILISPEHDLDTESELDNLLITPELCGHTAAYVEQIKYTPPELCGEFHDWALTHWFAIEVEPRHTQGAMTLR